MNMVTAVSWTTGAATIKILVQFGGGILLARLLGPTVLGEFLLSLAIVELLTVITNFSFATIFVQLDTRATATTAGTVFYSNCALAIAYIVIVWFVVLTTPIDIAWKILGPMTLSRAVAISTEVYNSIAVRQQVFKKISIINSILDIIGLSLALVLTQLFTNAMPLVAQYVIGNLSYVILALIVGNGAISFRASMFEFKRLWKGGRHLWVSSSIAKFRSHIERILLAQVVSVPSVAIYAKARSLTEVAPNFLLGTVRSILFSIFSKMQKDSEKFCKFYEINEYILVRATGLVFVLLVFQGQAAVTFLLGPKWLAAVDVLQILSVLAVLTPLIIHTRIGLLSMGLFSVVSKIAIFEVFGIVVGVVIGGMVAGIEGASVGVVGSAVMVYIIGQIELKRTVRISNIANYKFITGLVLFVVVGVSLLPKDTMSDRIYYEADVLFALSTIATYIVYLYFAERHAITDFISQWKRAR